MPCDPLRVSPHDAVRQQLYERQKAFGDYSRLAEIAAHDGMPERTPKEQAACRAKCEVCEHYGPPVEAEGRRCVCGDALAHEIVAKDAPRCCCSGAWQRPTAQRKLLTRQPHEVRQ